MPIGRVRIYREVQMVIRTSLELGAGALRSFSASFSIGGEEPVQQFVVAAFDTAEHAAAHAFELARQEIDRRLLEVTKVG
jgi:hypothetical protein